MDLLPAGSPISGAVLLNLSVHLVLGHLNGQGPFSPVTEFDQTTSSKKSTGGSQLLPLHSDEAHSAPGNFNTLEMVLYPCTCCHRGLQTGCT